jgi:hypothetical protein
MGQAAFVDAGAAASPRRRPLEESVEANWLAPSPGRAALFASPVPSPVGPSFTAGIATADTAETCVGCGADAAAGAEPKDCAEGIPGGIADKTGIAAETGDASTEASASPVAGLSSPRTKCVCAAAAFQALPAVGGCAATSGICSRVATAEACPTDAPAFFSLEALARTLLVAMGAAPSFFPPAGKLAVGKIFADDAGGKAERAGAAVATCGPSNCTISNSPNDAAGAVVAAGISTLAAAGLSAVTGTGAINPSASGQQDSTSRSGAKRRLLAGKSWRSGETA